MWSPGATLEFVIVAVVFWLVWRLVAALRQPDQPAEPEPGDYAGSPVRLRPRPRPGASAVAVAEPDEDDDLISCPPRITGHRP
jgi:hypothetical protein